MATRLSRDRAAAASISNWTRIVFTKAPWVTGVRSIDRAYVCDSSSIARSWHNLLQLLHIWHVGSVSGKLFLDGKCRVYRKEGNIISPTIIRALHITFEPSCIYICGNVTVVRHNTIAKY